MERILIWAAIIALVLNLIFTRDPVWLTWIPLVAILAFEGIRLCKETGPPLVTRSGTASLSPRSSSQGPRHYGKRTPG